MNEKLIRKLSFHKVFYAFMILTFMVSCNGGGGGGGGSQQGVKILFL